MSLLSLNQVSLKLAENVILQDANLQIHAKDRIALVGRNGAGKSTLIKLIQGEITPDRGVVQKANGIKIAGLIQDVPVSQHETVYHFLVKELGQVGMVLSAYHHAIIKNQVECIADYEQKIEQLDAWEILPRIESMANHLGLPIDEEVNSLSGGMRRRTLLGSALLAEPDLLLLDEPTNHLDVQAIEWLESHLAQYRGSLLLVTHDRQFLSQVANRIVEIDRGNLYAHNCNYETYLDRRESIRLAETKQNDLFDKRLKDEEAWIRQGVEARRTRNEGRVRRLKAMREAYRQRRDQIGQVNSMTLQAAYSGKIVLEASEVHYQINDQALIQDFSFLLMRGDKVGIIGPNGSGKTTLIRLLLGEIQPNSGTIRTGTSIEVAYFDQLRRQLDEKQTVMANVADGSDFVTINGQKKHVASYLKEFLFTPERFNQPVFSLSGGEKNRLLLAKLLARPVNLLVMDEPTNDLDIETLELLESMLRDYPGTLLLISHDREFINHVVTSIVVYEGQGRFQSYVGDSQDYQQMKKKRQQAATPTPASQNRSAPKVRAAHPIKLSYSEQRELDKLPQQIEQLEQQISLLHAEMTEPSFYQKDAKFIIEFNKNLATHEKNLAQYYARWEVLMKI